MAATDDALAVMNLLSGKTLTGARALQAAKDYIIYDEALNWTNEEIAQKFMDDMLTRAKHQIKAGAANLVLQANQSVVEQAADNAAVDL